MVWLVLALLLAFPLVCLAFFLPTGSGTRSDTGAEPPRRSRDHWHATYWS